MTEAELRAIDGPTLTRLAWDLGLAPPYATVDEEDPAMYRVPLFPEAPGYDWGWWEPHENVAQADAVFRSLRDRGWDTDIQWWQHGEESLVTAHKRDAQNKLMLCQEKFGAEGEPCEAITLLRCAVLAVWHDRKEP